MPSHDETANVELIKENLQLRQHIDNLKPDHDKEIEF